MTAKRGMYVNGTTAEIKFMRRTACRIGLDYRNSLDIMTE